MLIIISVTRSLSLSLTYPLSLFPISFSLLSFFFFLLFFFPPPSPISLPHSTILSNLHLPFFPFFPLFFLHSHHLFPASPISLARSMVISRSVTLDLPDQSSRSSGGVMTLITEELQSIANGFLAACLGSYNGIVKSGLTVAGTPLHHHSDSCPLVTLP